MKLLAKSRNGRTFEVTVHPKLIDSPTMYRRNYASQLFTTIDIDGEEHECSIGERREGFCTTLSQNAKTKLGITQSGDVAILTEKPIDFFEKKELLLDLAFRNFISERRSLGPTKWKAFDDFIYEVDTTGKTIQHINVQYLSVFHVLFEKNGMQIENGNGYGDISEELANEILTLSQKMKDEEEEKVKNEELAREKIKMDASEKAKSEGENIAIETVIEYMGDFEMYNTHIARPDGTFEWIKTEMR